MEPDRNAFEYAPEEIERLERWDREHVWHPFTQMRDYARTEPLIVARAEGAYLYDIQGRRYFDGNSSLWLNVHGHNHPYINGAVRRQLDRMAHTTLLGQANEPSIRLARRLAEITPAGLDKVFFSDNGSTAAEVALKMAFQYWQQAGDKRPSRKTFLTFDEAYHGDTVGSVSVGGIALFHGIFGPLLFKRHSMPYPVYSPFTSKETPEAINARLLDRCDDILKEHGDEIAAVLIEPLIQGASGLRTQSPGFLKGLRELCDKHDVFLIADEVFTGFGRTGSLFACEREGVTPDLMALAKGLTGGYLPVAATLTTDRVYEGFLGEYAEFKTFFHGHSYTGNPLGCAAALASLDVFEDENTLERIRPLSQHMARRLEELFARNDKIADIHHIGVVAGVDVARSRSKNEPFAIEEQAGARVCRALREDGIWLRPLGNTIVLVPPLIATPDEIDHLIQSIETRLNRLEA